MSDLTQFESYSRMYDANYEKCDIMAKDGRFAEARNCLRMCRFWNVMGKFDTTEEYRKIS